MRLSGLDIQHATGGQWHEAMPGSIESIVTDTRDFKSGQTFLALRGPNFDGHRFAASVADKALALIGDAHGIKLWKDLKVSQLEVTDTLVALGDIAHAWRMRLQGTTVVAISGSYGKTSLRSILEHGFTALGFNVVATQANLNNLIGVPQTLLQVPSDSDIALIECGISEQGEMKKLAAIVQPDIAVLTGLTHAHAEGLGGLNGVACEKADLLGNMNDAGWCVLGAGVAEVLKQADVAMSDQALVMDEHGAADTVVWSLDGRTLQLNYDSESAVFELQLPARHWAANMALAASIMLRYLKQTRPHGLSEVAHALSGWQAPAGRMHIVRGNNGSTVLDDCYNANPVSMQVAVDTLRALDGRRIAILGDMAELGEASQQAHAGMNVSGLDIVYLVGPQMKALADTHTEAIWFATTDDALRAISQQQFDSNDTLLVKASRSMRLESIVQVLSKKQEVADVI